MAPRVKATKKTQPAITLASVGLSPTLRKPFQAPRDRGLSFCCCSSSVFIKTSPAKGIIGASLGKHTMSQEGLHCVSLKDDDFTPMEFVVDVLQRFFDMDFDTATLTMLRVHNEGTAECGFYPRQEAEKKVTEVLAFAERHRHPLQCAFEKRE
jgi:ATP-dependent Clp protease adaptor protein ClpS